MNNKLFLGLAACFVLPVSLLVCCTGSSSKSLPCDIYAKGGTPCVTAHSTTRLLYSKYKGPLYQVSRDSDGKTLDIYPVKGYADAAAQDAFCEGTVSHITIIYDQSGKGNDLLPAGPGTFKGPDKGEFNTMSIADMAPVMVNGNKAYGVYIMPGMGYRCNNARGLAINDEAEGMYYVIDGNHFDSGCCFDYGNSSTNGKAVGTGTMETTYYGTATAWGSGNGNGPWIMSDMEAGLFSGYNAKKNDVPSITDWDFLSVFVNGGDGNQWDLRGNDASCDTLITFYSGVRPHTNEGSDAYYPMHKKGGMLLGNGGDNGNGSAGTFFEGVMTFGYPSDDAINAVQKNIASMGYAQYPLIVARISEFAPGSSKDVAVAFVNKTKKALKNFTLTAEVPEGWEVSPNGIEPASLDASTNRNVQFTLKAPQERTSGYVKFTASWDGGSVSSSERIRSTEPVRINEISLSTPDGLSPQFIELYNASDNAVDVSGLDIVVRRSGWASVKSASIPAGTTLAPHSFYLITEADAAASMEAKKGSKEIFLTKGVEAGSEVMIGNGKYRIEAAGVPAGGFTTIFSPVSTGPKLSIPAGATNIPVSSVAGFAAGQKMGIDLGGNFEAVTVTGVGTPATQTTLVNAAKAGDTVLYLDITSALLPGSELIVSTGDRMEKAIVKEVLKVSEAPAPRIPGQRPSGMTSREPGQVSLEKPLEMDHMAGVDVSCTGTGISFTPAVRFDHLSGDAVQPLGTAFTLSEALSEDIGMFETVMTEKVISLADTHFGYELSQSAGSIALVDPKNGTVVDAVVYGSQQSSSSANGTIASPELATLESVQDGGGCIAVVPSNRPNFRFMGQPVGPVLPKSLVRYPDGADTDRLCKDFITSELPTPGLPNVNTAK